MIERPRGTRDFGMEEMQKRRIVEKKMRSVFERYGYREVSTPIIESLDLFLKKSGKEIIKETYSFEDKGGRKIALRPELTAPVIRYYVNELQMEAKPLKLFYFGNCFRYDRPQKGRYREFWQMGCELMGTDNPEALAELIALAYHAIKETGLEDIDLRIGHLDYLGKQVEETLSSSDYYPADSSWKRDMFRLIDKEDYEGVKNQFEEVGAAQEKIDGFMNFLNSGSIDNLNKFIEPSKLKPYEEIMGLLKKFGITKVDVGMKIARGLDYYKGIVFEIDAPCLGAEKQLCGGGSYELIGLFGGKEIPTSGFAIGFDRVMMALEEEGYDFEFSPSVEVYIMSVNDDMIGIATKIASKLRESGMKVDMDLMRRKMKKAFEYANKIGAKKVVIVGPDEFERKVVIVKDMESGNEEEVKIDKINGWMEKNL